MPLNHHPKIGSIVFCAFNGEKPEMDSTHPAVVVSNENMPRSGLCTVVPLSTRPPDVVRKWHHLLAEKSTRALPPNKRAKPSWAKCDMVTTVSLQKLSFSGANSYGVGGNLGPPIANSDLEAIQHCILHVLRLWRLIPPTPPPAPPGDPPQGPLIPPGE